MSPQTIVRSFVDLGRAGPTWPSSRATAACSTAWTPRARAAPPSWLNCSSRPVILAVDCTKSTRTVAAARLGLPAARSAGAHPRGDLESDRRPSARVGGARGRSRRSAACRCWGPFPASPTSSSRNGTWGWCRPRSTIRWPGRSNRSPAWPSNTWTWTPWSACARQAPALRPGTAADAAGVARRRSASGSHAKQWQDSPPKPVAPHRRVPRCGLPVLLSGEPRSPGPGRCAADRDLSAGRSRNCRRWMPCTSAAVFPKRRAWPWRRTSRSSARCGGRSSKGCRSTPSAAARSSWARSSWSTKSITPWPAVLPVDLRLRRQTAGTRLHGAGNGGEQPLLSRGRHAARARVPLHLHAAVGGEGPHVRLPGPPRVRIRRPAGRPVLAATCWPLTRTCTPWGPRAGRPLVRAAVQFRSRV